METKIIKLSDIKINPRNAKAHAINEIKASILEMDVIEHIVVDENDMILAGHGRFEALKALGRQETEVIVKRGLTQEQKDRYLLLSNKLNEMGGWNYESLANYSEEELLRAHWKSEELDRIFQLSTEEDDFDVETEREKIIEPKVKSGDLYKLNEHRILCGDSKDSLSFEKLMSGANAKLVFTSPPYNMAGKMYENYADNLKSEEYIKFNLEVINNLKKYLKGFLFWNISYNKNARSEFIEIIYKITKETGLQFLELIVWDKGHAMPITSKEGLTRQYEDILLVGDEENISSDLELYFCGRNDRRAYFNKKTQKGITNYWRIGTNKAQLKNHLACFPMALPVKGMELMTIREEIVLDPFLGSGTTLIAAEKSGRKCYGVELDPIYVELTINRWEELTGQKAEKIG